MATSTDGTTDATTHITNGTIINDEDVSVSLSNVTSLSNEIMEPPISSSSSSSILLEHPTPKINNSQSSRRLLPNSSHSLPPETIEKDDTTTHTSGSIDALTSNVDLMPPVPSLDHHNHNHHITTTVDAVPDHPVIANGDDNDVLLGQLNTDITVNEANQDEEDAVIVPVASTSFFSWFSTTPSSQDPPLEAVTETTTTATTTTLVEHEDEELVQEDAVQREEEEDAESSVHETTIPKANDESRDVQDDPEVTEASSETEVRRNDESTPAVVEDDANDKAEEQGPDVIVVVDEAAAAEAALQKQEQVRVSSENADVFQTTAVATTTTGTAPLPANVSAVTSYDMEGIQWMIDVAATQCARTTDGSVSAGVVVVPHAATALQLIRKFLRTTQPLIDQNYGGTMPRSMWSYVFGGSSKNKNRHEQVTFHPYKTLVQILLSNDDDDDENINHNSEDDMVVVAAQSQGDESESGSFMNHVMDLPIENNTSDDIDPSVQEQCRAALSTFIDLFAVWGHASSSWYMDSTSNGSSSNATKKSSSTYTKQQHTYVTLQVSIMNTACQLITHGCLDDVYITMINNNISHQTLASNTGTATTAATHITTEDHTETGHDTVVLSPSTSTTATVVPIMAAQILASSIFNSDLTNVRVELVAMKFLLCTGCRRTKTSLLRGSYLLQSIRTLYHIYLTTESATNKVTARAALQQLVTNVFTKVVQEQSPPPPPSHTPATDAMNNSNSALVDGNTASFPSENHRDAFLVLRSICKLSMRSLPDDVPNHNMTLQTTTSSNHQQQQQHSHYGIQTSASNDMWDGDNRLASTGMNNHNSSERNGMSNESHNSAMSTSQQTTRKQRVSLVYTGAIHPALESKILALELLLYLLQNVDYTTNDFIHHCGTQFHLAIRNYLCVSLLKNCTCNNTHIVSLSLRIFVPVVQNFRTVLKNEIEAFVTNVFFVILQSKNSPAEHKSIVVNTFNEICSDPNTLAEIFLNYDCDLSAVDLFYRIVNTLSRLSREGLQQDSHHGSSGMTSGGGMTSFLLGGPTEAQMEKQRNESRNLRLDAMRALRQILASLHASIVEPMNNNATNNESGTNETTAEAVNDNNSVDTNFSNGSSEIKTHQQTLVDIYGSKKKRRAEEQEAILRFNQKPSAGIAYAAKCQHIDPDDPADVARYLLKNKDEFDKAMIGEYLGREKEYQNGFSIRVLHEYVRLMDFTDLVFDDAIRYFLSGFRLPGEAQKIDRIMEKFAERFTEQNPKVFPTADAAFILSFSIIMLNTDLHNPAIKEDRRMTKEGFIRNNQGICDGNDLPDAMLISIFDRIKQNPISLKEDDEARERAGDAKKKSSSGLPAALNPASFFSSHYSDADRARESNFQKERDHIVRTTESLLKRRRHGTEHKSPAKFRTAKAHRNASKFVLSGDSGLRDEYVSPMFEVTWGPALAAFSTAMESANGTAGTLISIASDDELERAAENAAETIEVCLTGFRLAIGTAALCGNYIARDAYMLALSRFTQLGTGILLEPRHIRCIQTMFSLAKEDGELLGTSWEHVFKALSEVNRFHQVFQLMARNDRAAAQAAERRLRRLEAMEQKRIARSQRKAAAEDGESIGEANTYDDSESDDNDSLDDSGIFSDEHEFDLEENMDAKAIDEANAREVYDAVSEATIEAIYERSSSLSATAVIEFVLQLCSVSRAEISVGTNSRPGDLNQVTYRQKHSRISGDQFHHTQPNIYNLQKLVEVTHYNMESRPRLLFADIWVTVADHLTNTALHSNPAVAMYAVDSFRQLSIQYLKRDELEVFEFQRRFLKPLETVMALSTQSTTKELLLNCVGRLMHVFGTGNGSDPTSSPKGGLRSGWVPILTILGIGGCDSDDGIAQTSFKALSDEIKLCLNENTPSGVLLTEYFVETVNALLMMNGSPHSEISILAVDYLVVLSDALAKGTISPVHTKRKLQPSNSINFESSKEDETMQSLELWWPILLGLSKSVGDVRLDVRSKSLEVLFELINNHFFPTDPNTKTQSAWETIQLIFRGILNSIIEFGESTSNDGPTPNLPMDFERLLTISKDDKMLKETQDDEPRNASWLETTFDPFMDACISLCSRSLKSDADSVLVEEIFALLNSCLLSDSGALVVRGIRRLEQFVIGDLNPTTLSDDIWATVSHMLQRCLVVRGLPKKHASSEGASEDQIKEMEMEYNDSVREFVAEDSFLLNRRFVGTIATMTIGSLLCSERFSIGLRWRLFLIKWLHRGIREWDSAAVLLLSITDNKQRPSLATHPHIPDYREASLYGRKWINRLILQLVSMTEIVQVSASSDPKVNRFAQGQKLVLELTEGLLTSFVQSEDVAMQYRHTDIDTILYNRYTELVQELLTGFGMMDDEYIQQMSWMNPVLLSSGIRCKNESIRFVVQKLVARTSSPPPPSATSASLPVPAAESTTTTTTEAAAALAPSPSTDVPLSNDPDNKARNE